MTDFFPIVGTMRHLVTDFKQKGDILASIKHSSRKYPHQKVLISNINTTIIIMLRDPEYIKEFMQNQNHYHKDKFVQFLKPLLGVGLIFAEGETWKRHRKFISNSFHYEFLAECAPLIQNTAREFLKEALLSYDNEFVAMDRIHEITGEIIGRIFFGKKLNSYRIEGRPITIELISLGSELSIAARTPLVILFGPKALNLSWIPQYSRVMNRIRRFREMCVTIVKDRKTHGNQGKDLLASFLETQDNPDQKQRFSDEDIVDEFITLFMAGMDTSAHLIAMALYNLTQYPEYLKELQEERDITYNKEKTITAETLQKMDVLASLLKETLRFYTPSPGPLGRSAIDI